MNHSKQSGFGIVGALLVLVVVGILGFTGWYVYHVKQTSDKVYSTAAISTVPTYKKKADTNTKSAANAKPQGSYLYFAQYSAKLLLNSSISDAVYAPFNNPPTGASVSYGISTQSIENAGTGAPGCSASEGPLGVINISTTDPLAPIIGNTTIPQTVDNKTLFKIGNYYFQIIYPQDSVTCGNISDTQIAADQQTFKQSFTTLQSDSSN